MRAYKTVVIILVGLKVLLHVLVFLFEGYGIFRDELYYLANTEHPAWGYVDHPPFSIWILDAFTAVFGDSWRILRLLSALAGGFAMWAVLRLVRTLGGNLVACWLAGIAFMLAPINLAYTSFYSMNVLELIFWPLAFTQLIKALREPEHTGHWAWLGVITGLGMMNKISMSWFAIGMIVFLLVSPYRRLFLQKGPYIAGLIALVLFLPFVIWNFTHDMAHIEFAENASRFKYAGITRTGFLAEQLLLEHPFILVFLVAAVLMLFSAKTVWANKMPLVIFFVTLLILLVMGNVKADYMAPAYLGIMACGAVRLSRAELRWQRRLLGVFVILHIVTGLILLPLPVPVLPEEDFIAYNAALGIGPGNRESKEEGRMPQFFADMHGWENFARTISGAYQELPDDMKPQTVAWVNNYGEAGALDHYRDKFPLPLVLSRHNAYYHWGLETLEERSFGVFLIVGGSAEEHGRVLENVRQVATIECTYCMPYENNLPVFLASDPKPEMDLLEIFRSSKNFN